MYQLATSLWLRQNQLLHKLAEEHYTTELLGEWPTALPPGICITQQEKNSSQAQQYMCVCIHVCIYVCMCMCVCVYECVCVCVCVCRGGCSNFNMENACMYMYVFTC